MLGVLLILTIHLIVTELLHGVVELKCTRANVCAGSHLSVGDESRLGDNDRHQSEVDNQLQRHADVDLQHDIFSEPKLLLRKPKWQDERHGVGSKYGYCRYVLARDHERGSWKDVYL